MVPQCSSGPNHDLGHHGRDFSPGQRVSIPDIVVFVILNVEFEGVPVPVVEVVLVIVQKFIMGILFMVIVFLFPIHPLM